MAKLMDIFNTDTCGRCGGSGRYSYNQIDGSKCYGCNGAGVKFTKGAQPFVVRWRTRKADLVGTEVWGLQAGDQVGLNGQWVTVAQVELDGYNAYRMLQGPFTAVGFLQAISYIATITLEDGTKVRDGQLARNAERRIKRRITAAGQAELNAIIQEAVDAGQATRVS